MKIKIYPKLLVVLLSMAIIPMVILTVFLVQTGKKSIKAEIEKGLVFRATDISSRVSDLLNNAADDLEVLKTLPPTPEVYRNFSKAKESGIWTRVGTNQKPEELRILAPLYREIAFIDKDGNERVKVENRLDQSSLPHGRYDVVTKSSPDTQLANVSDPKNTLYKTEDYFQKAKRLPDGEIYIGHLVGWYVNAREQLGDKERPEDAVEGRRYDGAIRFAAPVYDGAGKFEGIVVLALDQSHLQEIIIHTDPVHEYRVDFAPYSSGNYVYLFDDEGWIIAHPKLWDLRGQDENAVEVKPFDNAVGTNRGPVNLVRGPINEAHYKLQKLLEDILNKRSGVFDLVNLGLNRREPATRAQAYAPILFSRGDYKMRQVFGGVTVGANLSSVNLTVMSMLEKFFVVLIAIVVIVLVLAPLVARSITRPIRLLARASKEIAAGNLDQAVPSLGRDEIGDLGFDFNRMAANLKNKIVQIEESKERQISLQRQIADMEKKEKINLKSRIDTLEKEIAEKPFEGMIYESDIVKRLLVIVNDLARTDAAALILGERGTGKEMIASAIHSLSPRKNDAYLRVNCTAIPETLIESELFGHAKGSFTGAHKDKIGFFEAASGGTLLLDEIGDLSPGIQAKLLRVLQEKKITRVGETRERVIDTRLIAATNQDLGARVRAGAFRADLFDRLNVFPIHIPPLRERREDILPLAKYFLQRAVVRYNKNILGISEEAVDAMLKFPWPGNVRELGNAIDRAVIRAHDDHIEKDDLVMDEAQAGSGAELELPDMSIEELKVYYAKSLRGKYPSKPLKEIKDILKIDWNTLRKYLSA